MGLIRFIARVFLVKTVAQRLKRDRKNGTWNPMSSSDGASLAAGAPTITRTRSAGGSGASQPGRPVSAQPDGAPGPDTPYELPAHDWKWAAKTTLKEIKCDRITFIGAGMAYYMFLAIFPALIAGLGIMGLAEVDTQPVVDAIKSQLPGGSGGTVISVVENSVARSEKSSLIAAIVGMAIALWSASTAFVAMQSGLNIAFHVPQDRKFISARLTALGLIIVTGLLGVLPPALFSMSDNSVVGVIGWIVSALSVILLFSVYYYLGPKREKPKWQWVSPGGIVGVVIWLLGSTAFGIYLGNFASYGQTYGPVTAFIVLILWLYITSIAILIGGELNAQLEEKAEDPTP